MVVMGLVSGGMLASLQIMNNSLKVQRGSQEGTAFEDLKTELRLATATRASCMSTFGGQNVGGTGELQLISGSRTIARNTNYRNLVVTSLRYSTAADASSAPPNIILQAEAAADQSVPALMRKKFMHKMRITATTPGNAITDCYSKESMEQVCADAGGRYDALTGECIINAQSMKLVDVTTQGTDYSLFPNPATYGQQGLALDTLAKALCDLSVNYCKNESGVDNNQLLLYLGKHSKFDCARAGGTVVNVTEGRICKFVAPNQLDEFMNGPPYAPPSAACIASGGTVFNLNWPAGDLTCRRMNPDVSCPAGWSWHLKWSKTRLRPGGCTQINYAAPNPKPHNWMNKDPVPEAGTYQEEVCTPDGSGGQICNMVNKTCSPQIQEIGCL
jgi:hypothetical protein